MHDNTSITTLLSSTTPVAPVHNENVVLARANPRRWLFAHHREVMGLQPYILPVPLMEGPEGKKFQRIAHAWSLARSKLFDAEPDVAIKIALMTSDKFFDRLARRPKVKIHFLEDDLFDPGRKYDLALERVAHLLYEVDVKDVAGAMEHPGYADKIAIIENVADDLLEFHAQHMTANDIRFAPVRAFGLCLTSLVSVIRRAA